jgi:hypothetical protein
MMPRKYTRSIYVHIYCDERGLWEGAENLFKVLRSADIPVKAKFVLNKYERSQAMSLRKRKKKVDILVAYKRRTQEAIGFLKNLRSEDRPKAVMLVQFVQFDDSEKYLEEFVLFADELKRGGMSVYISFNDTALEVVTGILKQRHML